MIIILADIGRVFWFNSLNELNGFIPLLQGLADFAEYQIAHGETQGCLACVYPVEEENELKVRQYLDQLPDKPFIDASDDIADNYTWFVSRVGDRQVSGLTQRKEE